MLERKWSTYVCIIVTIVIMGLGSRHFAMYLPSWVNLYFGDFLWALMNFFLIGLLFRKKKTQWVIVIALVFCYLVEISQIYHVPWIETLRQTRVGGLILGRGFLWSDLISYTFGIAIGALIERHMSKNVKNLRQLDKDKIIHFVATLIFIVYFSYLLYRLFFFAYGQYYRFYSHEIRYNLIPFKTIITYIVGINNYKLNVWFFNLFGNALAFMPMGFLLPLMIKDAGSFKKIAIITFSISITVEILQLYLRLGVSDIDDVIINTLGGLLGYYLLEIIRRLIRLRRPKSG